MSKAWSYSSLTSFETCAHRHHETKVVKRVYDPPNVSAEWGNLVHRALELRITNGTPMPEGMEYLEPLAERIRTAGTRPGRQLYGELKVALNGDLQPVAYFAKDVWVRVVIDVMIEGAKKAWIGDHKTGAMKHNSQQLALSAAVTLASKPWLKEVRSTFLWIKENRVTDDKFTRDDIPRIWQEFLPRVQRLNHAHQTNEWPKKPSGLCSWCPVKTCEFWKPPRR